MTINDVIKTKFVQEDLFTLAEAVEEVNEKLTVKEPSIRARIYEMIDRNELERVSVGVYTFNGILLIQGNGRDLSFIEDGSIDAIITDHPYSLPKSHKGGNRNFTSEYSTFQYSQEDFDEKARVLKEGSFLIEFLPEENSDNFEYLHQIKLMARNSGLEYFAKVPWKKGNFVANTGRKSKNTEDVMFFTKGKARSLRIDAKKVKNLGGEHFMSGASKMLPTVFDYDRAKKQTHQAEKPFELLEEIIMLVTKENEIVLDQFTGSGSIAEAVINKSRRGIFIEIDENNVELIKNRIKNIIN